MIHLEGDCESDSNESRVLCLVMGMTGSNMSEEVKELGAIRCHM